MVRKEDDNMTTKDLAGKVALVTGASRGIGRAIALALSQMGADIAVNYRTQEREAQDLRSHIRELGVRCIVVQADVAAAADVSRLAEAVRKELGGADIVVNNAGIAKARSFNEITGNDWDETIAVNLTSAFLVIQAVLPSMRARHWGRIINIASVAAQVGGIVGPHYAAAKAGLAGLTHYYATYLAREGITVNTIAPGLVRTAMAAGLPQLNESLIPVGRLGTPEEVALAAGMLACNGYITGQTINVNGGRYMG